MGSIVRHGEEKDFPEIIEMAREFWAQTHYKDETFCEDSVTDVLKMCAENKLLSVLEADGELQGFAMGVQSVLLANHNIKVGAELAWWVNPSQRNGVNGLKLLTHIEKLAKEAGIKYWNMIYMETSMPEKIKQIYECLGYKKTETTYTRSL